MKLLFELSNVIIEALLVLYYLQCVYTHIALRKPLIILLFSSYTVILALLSIFPVSAFFRIAYSMLSMLFLCIIIYHSKIINAIYASLAFNIVVVLADVFCIIILGTLGYKIENLDLGGSRRVICIVIAKLIVLIGIQILTRLIHRNNNRFPQWTVPLILGQAVSIAIALIALHVTMNDTNDDLLIISLGFGLLYLNLIICFYCESIKNAYESRYRTELAEQQLQLQIDFYNKEQKEKNATRALWHDIRKYLFTMYDLLESGNSTEALECVKQLENTIGEIHKTVDVGNVVVNGILDRAVELIRGTGIKLVFDVWVPSKIDIAAVDLYIILGNTIDNAIEACLQVNQSDQEPTIKLILKQHDHFLYYEISNPFPEKRAPKSGSNHGYGLSNVQMCTKKHGGTMTLTDDKQQYKVVIRIPV